MFGYHLYNSENQLKGINGELNQLPPQNMNMNDFLGQNSQPPGQPGMNQQQLPGQGGMDQSGQMNPQAMQMNQQPGGYGQQQRMAMNPG